MKLFYKLLALIILRKFGFEFENTTFSLIIGGIPTFFCRLLYEFRKCRGDIALKLLLLID